MTKRDAEIKFFEAVRNFRTAEEAAKGLPKNLDQRAFRAVQIDLDAALPGLDSIARGQALLLKAASQYWIYVGQVSEYDSAIDLLDDETGQAHLESLRNEALSWALQGKEIVTIYGTASDLSWAESLIKVLGGNG